MITDPAPIFTVPELTTSPSIFATSAKNSDELVFPFTVPVTTIFPLQLIFPFIVPWISKEPDDCKSPVRTVLAVIKDVSSCISPVGIIVFIVGVSLIFLVCSSFVFVGISLLTAAVSANVSFTIGLTAACFGCSLLTVSKSPSNFESSDSTSTFSPIVSTTRLSVAFVSGVPSGPSSLIACEKSSLKSLNNPINISSVFYSTVSALIY